MQGDMCTLSDPFPWAMLAVVVILVAFIIFYKEDPWERAKRVLIYKIRQRDDPMCRCDDVDKLIAAEMNGVVINV
jgi:hypothetical protein